MADVQTENGHTIMANILIDNLAKIRISGEEMQCLWVIIRKTWGYHKKTAELSLTYFASATNLKRKSVYKALNKLLQKNIITKNGDKFITSYSIQKDYEKWIPLPKKVTVKCIVPKKGNTLVPNIGSELSPKKTPNKDIKTDKDNKDKLIVGKKKTNPDIKVLIDEFFNRHLKKFNVQYKVMGAKDSSLIKDLLGTFTKEQISRSMDKFFASDDDFMKNKGGYTIGVFYSQINKLNTVKTQEEIKNEGRGIQF